MGIRYYKPVTPGRRSASISDFAEITDKKKKPEKLKGRPNGVLNKDKTRLELSEELLRINQLLKLTVQLIGVFVSVKYLALDGHFGHHQAVLMARANGLELISKLRKEAALFEKYAGEYGAKVSAENMARDSIIRRYRRNI